MLDKDARGQLLDNTDQLVKQDQQVANVTKVGHETLGTTNVIITNLRQQRDKVINADHDILEAKKNVALGKQVINTMSRQECCYKALLYLLIVALFAAICALATVKLMK